MNRTVIDHVLRRAIARAAAPNGLRFTERQLYYEVCRVVLPVHRLPRNPSFTVPAAVPYGTFRAALRRHGAVPGMLDVSPPRPTTVGRHTPEPDLFDYGLPRLLVCQSHPVAEMLRANGMPMESACPVLSVAELPLDPRVTAMLGRGGGTVYVLHDADTDGLLLPERLAALTEIPDGVRVTPIGLLHAQAAPLHLTRRPNSSGCAVEVEAVNPAVLLRTVHRLVRDVHRTRPPLIELRRARHTGFLTWPTA